MIGNTAKKQFDLLQMTTMNKINITVVDSFMYNGEPVIPIRLELLYNVVDHFYIVEGSTTFSGKVKEELFKDINADDFKPYEDKISWIVVDDPPNSNFDSWQREYYQRNCTTQEIKLGLDKGIISKPFVIIATDADEIPNPKVI